MPKANITEKFTQYTHHKLYTLLSVEQQNLVRDLALEFRFTFQEFRQVTEFCRDLDMWSEQSLADWWLDYRRLCGTYTDVRKYKKHFLSTLQLHLTELKEAAKSYTENPNKKPHKPEKSLIAAGKPDTDIYGWCPVASEKTVCCNLHTIDAVESCAFGCSYCTIQTFYKDNIYIEENIKEKLDKIELSEDRRYHIGTGQSSDALVWGNRNGILDDLVAFARQHPNVLLEFKTKSDNISYFLGNEIPSYIPENIVCSWSLNPQIIIDNEEHYTASLEKRLSSALAVADKGVKVAFHFHPIIYYDDWESAYPAIAQTILEQFRPEEILFISFGSVTFIKPVIKKIRERGLPTKILQMDFVTDPHGKLTYADEIKINKFRLMYESFKSWHQQVFFYLCMEKAELWEKSLGYVYETNEDFEQALLDSSFSKIIYGLFMYLSEYWIEIVGYSGSFLVALSLSMKSISRLRKIN